jgi:MFS family permease
LLDSVQNSKALMSMIFARIIYAINWMNVGAIFFLMGPDLKSGVSGLGTLTAAFYLGIGIMQVPGGILVAKWGPKKVSVIGVFLASIPALGTSVMTTIPEIAILRFLVGAGMAFVFAPGVVIVARLLRGGKSGIGVGLYNSAYDVGGALALFGWVVVAEVTGWRLSLAVSGGLGVLSGVLTLLLVPRDQANLVPTVGRRPLLTILKDKQLIMVGLGMLGFDMSNSTVSGFMIYYLLSINAVSATVAGLVASLVTIVPIFTSLWAGRIYDSIERHRFTMAVGVVGSAVALALGAYPSIYAAVACSVLAGVVAGVGYTFGFAGARDLNRAGKEYEGLAIAWVNSIHLTGSVIPPILFSFVVERLGYSQAWLWCAVATLLFLGPLLLMIEHWRR